MSPANNILQRSLRSAFLTARNMYHEVRHVQLRITADDELTLRPLSFSEDEWQKTVFSLFVTIARMDEDGPNTIKVTVSAADTRYVALVIMDCDKTVSINLEDVSAEDR